MKIALRPLVSDDLEAFWQWASDPEVAKWMAWQPYTCKADACAFLERPHPWLMGICLEGHPVGYLELSQGEGPHRCRARISYAVARPYWGQGIATQALAQGLQEGFVDLQVARIEAFVPPTNIASQRVAEKVGMGRDGLFKHYMWVKGKIRDFYIYSKFLE